MADKKENLIEEEVKETKKATRKKKSDEDSAKSTAKKPRKGKEGAEAELTEEEKAQAIQEKFMEKCRGILAIAKKKKNVLDYKEIMNYFQDTDFEADKMEKVFEFLEACNVDVKMNDDEVEEDDILLDDEDDIEVFKYAEKLPVALDGYTNLYEYADLCYTNMLVDINDDKLYKLYKTEGKVLEFY